MRSLTEDKITDFEILLIDNGSTDETQTQGEKLAKSEGRFTYYRSNHNLGYAGGMNFGIGKSKGGIVFLLNNDLEFASGWCKPLLEMIESRRDVGAVGPLTNSAGNWQRVGLSKASMRMPALLARGTLRILDQSSTEVHNLGFFCVGIKREVFDNIGLLDESFEIGMFEDDEYCLRMRIASYKMVIVENSYVNHVGSASFKQLNSQEYSRIWEKNKEYFESKHKIRLLPNRYFIEYAYNHLFNPHKTGNQHSVEVRSRIRRLDWQKVRFSELLSNVQMKGGRRVLRNLEANPTYLNKLLILNVILFIALRNRIFKLAGKNGYRRLSALTITAKARTRLFVRTCYLKGHYIFWKILASLVYFRESVNLAISVLRKKVMNPKLEYVVFPQTVDFSFMRQRPQQLSVALSQLSAIAIYFTTNSQSDSISHFEWVDKRLVVVNYRYRALLRFLNYSRKTTFFCIWPTNYDYLNLFKPKKIIYDICDRLELLGETPLNRLSIQNAHLALCSEASYITYTAKNLSTLIPTHFAYKSRYLPNAVASEFLNVAQMRTPRLNTNQKLRLVYFGYMGEWLDFKLIKEFANCGIVDQVSLFGNIDQKLSKYFSKFLSDNMNVQYRGSVSNIEMAGLLHTFDVGIIPFLNNKITQSVSPVKLFEYAAGSLPVLSFSNSEIPMIEGIYRYENHTEALENLKIIAANRSLKMQATLCEFGAKNLWLHRAHEVSNFCIKP
jgi:GT2 family glycosyltransferase